MKFNRNQEMATALMFKALSHPARIWIVRQLAQEEHCVCEFVKALDVEFATVSRHLAKLRNAGILTCRKRGREIWYGLDRERIRSMFTGLC